MFRRSAWLKVAAGLVGIAIGAEVDIIGYMTGRYFGLRAFGEIYGYAFASFALAGALGPVLMGLGFDHTGSYKTVLLGFLAATVTASVAILRLGPYRYRPHQEPSHNARRWRCSMSREGSHWAS